MWNRYSVRSNYDSLLHCLCDVMSDTYNEKKISFDKTGWLSRAGQTMVPQRVLARPGNEHTTLNLSRIRGRSIAASTLGLGVGSVRALATSEEWCDVVQLGDLSLIGWCLRQIHKWHFPWLTKDDAYEMQNVWVGSLSEKRNGGSSLCSSCHTLSLTILSRYGLSWRRRYISYIVRSSHAGQ